jgi:hypothetical protein
MGKTHGVTPWTPPLQLDARSDRCRLTLEGVTYGNGETLQEAGNDLLVRLHDLALGLRRGDSSSGTGATRMDPKVYGFLWELGEIAVRGGDLRERVFGGQ